MKWGLINEKLDLINRKAVVKELKAERFEQENIGREHMYRLECLDRLVVMSSSGITRCMT